LLVLHATEWLPPIQQVVLEAAQPPEINHILESILCDTSLLPRPKHPQRYRSMNSAPGSVSDTFPHFYGRRSGIQVQNHVLLYGFSYTSLEKPVL
jgi:hypothetical protein